MSLLKDKIKNIINKKKTNICLSADVTSIAELFSLIELLGDNICMLKLHHDIIVDFFDNLNYTINVLNFYKDKYDFVIWEDRKFADIGYIMEKQVKNHISKWADVISVHPISGVESVIQLNFIPVILIGELSSTGSLTTNEYSSKVEEMEDYLSNLVGYVCQHKMGKNVLNFVPGISLLSGVDNKGQQYRSLSDNYLDFADIFVVGRAITNSDNPKKTILNMLSIINNV